MNKKVFISGSISIKKLPKEAQKSIDNIINKNFEILVGDAKGVDSLVQRYCASRGYYNVKVYSIYDAPRNKISDKFRFEKVEVSESVRRKRESERQQAKDQAMTRDCDYCLVIWNGRSKGSYANILRAKELKKGLKVVINN
ncbi:MAG: hypothetical protein DRP41_02150 [Thermodesulfobacteriota bacterium]|nr:MAG: hypothetical protein DRP41_02150 [Thermodesulfobacteriota bacterium]